MLSVSKQPFCSEKKKENRRPTIGIHGFPVWWSNTENSSNEDILETRNQKQARILIIESLELFIIDVGRSVPWFSPDPEENKDLNSGVDEDLTNDTGQHLLGDQACSWSFGVDFGVR